MNQSDVLENRSSFIPPSMSKPALENPCGGYAAHYANATGELLLVRMLAICMQSIDRSNQDGRRRRPL
jgi:hypothetical protein